MKKAAKIFVSIVVIVAILISVVFFMASGMTDTATAFFTAVKEKNYERAYSYLSEDFKTNTSQAELLKYLEKSALLKFKEASWGSRTVSGGKGELDGSVITETGGVVPITMSFVKENESWKIYSMFKPVAGLAQNDPSGKLPPIDELMKLTDESLMKFADSVNAKDFKEFYSYVARLWQKQTTVEKFTEIFDPFVNTGINIMPVLKNTNPIFDVEPSINGDGVLILEGHYPSQPSKLMFKLKYIYEGIGWRLFGINVNIN